MTCVDEIKRESECIDGLKNVVEHSPKVKMMQNKRDNTK